jgi:predicted MFS family arabinose efflux permease
MVGSLLVFGLGNLVVARPAFWALGVALALTGVAKVVFDPAMQAYVGDVVPYGQRGKALAITELSWSLAILVGVPIIGFVIAGLGWQAPFIGLGLFGILAALLLAWVLPPTRVHLTHAASWSAMVRVVRKYPVMWAAALYVLLAMGANELLLIVYGQWMEGAFGLSLTSLGLASAVIGGAEIVGEGIAGWSVDRLGKRRVIIATGLLTSLLYLLIPYTALSLPLALLTLFAVFVSFEVTIVGGVPLMTEVVPSARAVVLSLVIGAAGVGRMLGALIGPEVWARAQLPGNTSLAAVVMLVGVLVLQRWVREGDAEPAGATPDA